jgi:hypothetical protein
MVDELMQDLTLPGLIGFDVRTDVFSFTRPKPQRVALTWLKDIRNLVPIVR